MIVSGSLDEIKIKIIISHRNSTVKSYNKIIQFDKNDIKKIENL